MPGSGINLLWNEIAPADSDNAGGGAGAIRSLETSVRNGLAVEHNWPSATGANFGYHLLGSCRPFYDAQSNVSSTGTDARLLLTSDTSRLFGVGSGGTVLLGDTNLLSVGTTTGITRPQRAYWACEFGLAVTGSNGSVVVTFPSSGFSGVPFVLVTPKVPAGNNGQFMGRVMGISATSFEVATAFASFVNGLTVPTGSITFNWLSIGTRAL